jgi:hypothetical protein
MKTITLHAKHQNSKQCVKSNLSLLCWQFWLASLPIHATKSLSRLIARVRQVTLVILPAKILDQARALQLAFTNRATYVGILIVSLAPVTENMFMLFNEHAGTKEDYWNAYYYLHAIGPHIHLILLVTGLVMLPKHVVKYAAIIPITYKFASIIWLASIDSNEQFHKAAPFAFIAAGLTVTIVWVTCFNWLMSLHFHKKQGTMSRIVGILTTPNIEEHKSYTIAKSEAVKYLELSKQ